MNKKIIIAVGLIVVTLGVFMMVKLATAQTDSGSDTDNPVAAVTPVIGEPQGSTFQIQTSQGNVTVNNIYDVPFIIDGEYLISQDNGTWQINYDTETSQFDLYFYDVPTTSVVSQGENALLQLLQVSQTDACKLNILEEYPGNTSPAAQSNNLSFCGTPALTQ